MPYEIAGEKPWEAICFPMFELVFRYRHTKKERCLLRIYKVENQKTMRVSVNG
jgi:hypothetical protein